MALLVLSGSPALAQKPPKIGVTLAGSAPDPYAEAFKRGLAAEGLVAGKNIQVEYRYAAGRHERFAGFMEEFVRSNVQVIVAGGGPHAIRAATRASSNIPIVAPVMADPVAAGLAKTLARPGGQVTGLSLMVADTSGKRLELLREVFPDVKQIAALVDPVNDLGQRRATEEAARTFGFDVSFFQARGPDEFEQALQRATTGGAQALVVFSSGVYNAHRRRLVELAARSRLPAIYANREYVEAGGLFSYGVDVADLYRMAAKHVDRILKGAKPGELPFQQPTKFELVINPGVAKGLGITFPKAFALRADHVINQ